MSDFHRSLDRALEVDPHNDWGIEDITSLIEAVNADIKTLAPLSGLEPVAYDGFGAPLYAHQIPAVGTE